jgi:hypothetical protein
VSLSTESVVAAPCELSCDSELLKQLRSHTRTSHGRHQMPCSIGTPSAIAPHTCAVPWHEHCDGADGRAVRMALDSSVGQPSGAGPRHPIGRIQRGQKEAQSSIRLRWPEQGIELVLARVPHITFPAPGTPTCTAACWGYFRRGRQHPLCCSGLRVVGAL